MKAFAYATHLRCYTQPGASICNLPLGDLHQIRETITLPDTLAGDGRRQIGEVAVLCRSDAPDDGRRTIWRVIAMLSH